MTLLVIALIILVALAALYVVRCVSRKSKGGGFLGDIDFGSWGDGGGGDSGGGGGGD